MMKALWILNLIIRILVSLIYFVSSWNTADMETAADFLEPKNLFRVVFALEKIPKGSILAQRWPGYSIPKTFPEVKVLN